MSITIASLCVQNQGEIRKEERWNVFKSLSQGSNPSSLSSSFKLEITNLCTTTIVPLTAILYGLFFHIDMCLHRQSYYQNVFTMGRSRFTWMQREHIPVITGTVFVVIKAFSICSNLSLATYLLMPMAPEPSASKVPAVSMRQKSEGRKKPWYLSREN